MVEVKESEEATSITTLRKKCTIRLDHIDLGMLWVFFMSLPMWLSTACSCAESKRKAIVNKNSLCSIRHKC